ncbi:NINE protein [Neptuniibacter sp. QD48_55]|uniref:NINE protein n=1 Tax=Neptuniibacter sp. QD48_55 TaxID=3398212 RepID=UPI0039F494AA
METSQQPSKKSYAVAVSLSAIFGVLGIHHFYLGRYLEGIIDFSLFVITMYFYLNGELLWALLFFVVDGLHTFVITIMLLTGSFKDGQGRYVCYPGQKLKQANQG